MSTIRLSASLASIGAPFSLTGFEESDGKAGKTVLPFVKDGEVIWDVPDTPANRTRIRQEYEPSGKFKAVQVHVKQADPFKAITTGGDSDGDSEGGDAGGDPDGDPEGGDANGDPEGDPEGGDADGDPEGDVTGDKKAGKGNKSNKKK